jgi:hypothetical protein
MAKMANKTRSKTQMEARKHTVSETVCHRKKFSHAFLIETVYKKEVYLT